MVFGVVAINSCIAIDGRKVLSSAVFGRFYVRRDIYVYEPAGKGDRLFPGYSYMVFSPVVFCFGIGFLVRYV